MIKTINIVAASVLLATASLAMADDVMSTENSGFYVGALLGDGRVAYTNASTGSVVSRNHGIDGGINAGYMITNNFGVETGLIQYSKVKLTDGSTITDNNNLYVAGVAKYNFSNDFNVFGKLGLARVHTKLPESLTFSNGAVVTKGGYSKFSGFGALGVGYMATQNVQLSVESDLSTKSSNIPGMVSLNAGVSYLF